jgi:nitrite reductase (NADH) large subunit
VQFKGADMSTKLKLLGVDVAAVGDALARTEGALNYVYTDEVAGTYKKLVVSPDGKRLLGAILVGDAADYGGLQQMMLNALPLPKHPEDLILPAREGGAPTGLGVDMLPDTAPAPARPLPIPRRRKTARRSARCRARRAASAGT